MKLVLLDAHAILHRAYHALPDFSTSKGEPTGGLYGLSAMLLKIIEDLKPDYIAACYDVHGPTFRHDAYKDYKAGRKKADDALVAQMGRSRDIFAALNIPIYDKQGFEADDMLGTIVEQLRAKTDAGDISIVIASGDMDTLQLVQGSEVQVYTLKKGIKDTIMYDENAVRERFGFGPELIPDYKGLRGDNSDNIKGIKGIGDKTATILITTFGTIEAMYKELDAGHDEKFRKAGITPRIIELLRSNKDEAEFSKVLATIRRNAPVTYVFPEKIFRQTVDVKQATALWTTLEFRTFGQRLTQILANWDLKKGAKKSAVKSVDTAGDVSRNDEAVNGGTANGQAMKDRAAKGSRPSREEPRPSPDNGQNGLFASVPADEVEKTGLALWLVNSTLTNPTLDDIRNFSDAGSYEEARTAVFAELDRRNLRTVYETIELPLIPILHRMEKRGIQVARPVLADLAERYHAELGRLERQIWKEAGTEFNINSPRQLGDVLFDRLSLKGKNMKKTSGGARSTRESELEKLKDLHPVVPMIFEYRELAKLLGTYIDAIPPLLDADDRLHTHFISAGSTTGRMATQNPGMQNIPIKSDLGRAIRKAFVAGKGFKLASFDYSQMELRIAAFLSGDEKLIEIFRRGEDVHTAVAASVFKVPQTDVTPAMRRQAKVINFGIIYGMGVLALKQNLGTSRDEAQKFYNDYFQTFSTLASYLDRIKAEAARKGYTETMFGRRRYFEGINSKIPYIRAQAERMAINAPIQGTEADVIKLAMIHIDKWIAENGLAEDVFPLLQVHDELIYEIHEEKAAEVAPQIEKLMESVVDPARTEDIVLKASAAVGNDWGELK